MKYKILTALLLLSLSGYSQITDTNNVPQYNSIIITHFFDYNQNLTIVCNPYRGDYAIMDKVTRGLVVRQEYGNGYWRFIDYYLSRDEFERKSNVCRFSTMEGARAIIDSMRIEYQRNIHDDSVNRALHTWKICN